MSDIDKQYLELQDEIAAMAQPMSTAPRDRVINVFLPRKHTKGKGLHKAHWRRAIWCQDNRDERSEKRHNLMMRHDGYWGTPREGNAPLPYQPTAWIPDLPNLEEYEDA